MEQEQYPRYIANMVITSPHADVVIPNVDIWSFLFENKDPATFNDSKGILPLPTVDYMETMY